MDGYPYRLLKIGLPVLNLVLCLVLALRSIVSVLSCVTDVGSRSVVAL